MYKAGQITRTTIFYLFMFCLAIALSVRPMLADLSNRSNRATAAAQLHSLRTALISFQSDLKHLPFSGSDPFRPDAYIETMPFLFPNGNVEGLLLNQKIAGIGSGWQNLGMPVSRYINRWKGPYINSAGSNYTMTDLWGNTVAYYAIDEGKFLRVFLHSPGPDRQFDLPTAHNSGFSYKFSGIYHHGKQQNWKFSSKCLIHAHDRLYDGDDIVLEVATVRKPMTASRQTGRAMTRN